MYNSTAHQRSPESQNNYEDWELKVILAVNGKGVTAKMLTHVLDRSETSIARKACDIGSSLKGKGKL